MGGEGSSPIHLCSRDHKNADAVGLFVSMLSSSGDLLWYSDWESNFRNVIVNFPISLRTYG